MNILKKLVFNYYKIVLISIFIVFLSSCSTMELLVSKKQWDYLFSERWGIGKMWLDIYPKEQSYYPDMQLDYYSYENFVRALADLQKIKLKEVVEGDQVKIYRKKLIQVTNDWQFLYSYKIENSNRQKYEKEVNFNHFLNAPEATKKDHLRELAAFLANISHETGEGKDQDAQGLFYREALVYEKSPDWGIPTQYYRDNNSMTFPPSQDACLYVKGSKKEGQTRFLAKSYHGRGPIQLSWNFNYGALSLVLFGDKNILLDNPNLLLEDGKYGFMAAIWLWMFPQYPQPSPHEVMYKNKFVSTHIDKWGFGHTIMILNGGIEGNAVEGGSELKDLAVTRRIMFYKKYAKFFGVDIGNNEEQLDTKGMKPYNDYVGSSLIEL